MKRRTYLATTVGVVGALAGCTGESASDSNPTETTASTPAPETSQEYPTNGDYPADENPDDGYPPEMPEDPPDPEFDPSTFDTTEVDGQTVRLAPIDLVQNWYHRGTARFVDARGAEQYEQAHIYGAVLSPATRGAEGGGIEGWPTGDRVVTYCGCPHHLSSIRAAGLQKAGYGDIYAIDEGFFEWADRGFPMAGQSFAQGTQASRSEWEITGETDPAYVGEYVWASAAQQSEAAPVQSDGRYRVHLRFTGVDADTTVTVHTPEATVERPLGTVGTRL